MIEQGFDIFIVDIIFRTVFALAACEIGSRKGRNAGLCAILGFLTGPIGLLAAAMMKSR